MGKNENEYFERWLRLKPVIEANEDLINNIASIFKGYGKNFKDIDFKKLMHLEPLGSGDTRAIYWIGNITDPSNKKNLDIAIKFKYRKIYYKISRPLLKGVIGAFEKAFIEGMDPPYFTGVVCTENGIAAIITQDVSKKHTLKMRECGNECCVVSNNGIEERFFIDPLSINEDLGEKYLKKENRINLRMNELLQQNI